RIDLAVVNAPLAECHHVDLVEGAKPLLGERRGRAQLAGAERGERPSRLGDDTLDAREALLERHRIAEAHALDLVAIVRGGAAGILEDARNETVVARGEIGGGRHRRTLSAGCISALAR